MQRKKKVEESLRTRRKNNGRQKIVDDQKQALIDRGQRMKAIRLDNGETVGSVIRRKPSFFITHEGLSGVEDGKTTTENGIRWLADVYGKHPATLMLRRAYIHKLDSLFNRIANLFEEVPVKEEDALFYEIEARVSALEKLRKNREQVVTDMVRMPREEYRRMVSTMDDLRKRLDEFAPKN